MRKQYHLKRIDGILHAWDIDKLVELTKNNPILNIPISFISELDEPYWFETAPTCREIAEHIQLCDEADLAYPIILSSTGRVMDGMHRIVKAVLKGEKYIKAVRLKNDPSPDFVNIEADNLPY